MVFFTVCVVILCFLVPAAAVWFGSRVARPQSAPDRLVARPPARELLPPLQRHERPALVAFPLLRAAGARGTAAPPRDTCAPARSGTGHGAQASVRDVRRTRPPAPLARRPPRRPGAFAAAARRPRGERAGGDQRAARAPGRPLLAGRLRHRLGLDRRLARAQLRLGRRQGDRLEGGARCAARPAPRALRARHAGALHRLPAQHRAVRPRRRGRARRGARPPPAADRRRASPRARSPARRSPSSSCSASRWRWRSSRSRPCCTCRTWSGSS